MRQNLYTCCRCGREERTSIECDDAPLGWALVKYEQVAVVEERTLLTTLTTHACESCSAEVLAFLEKKTPRKDIDRAFDDGEIA